MPAAARQRVEDARGTVDRLDPPRFVRFPRVFGIAESKWSLQGGAHWSAASEWRGHKAPVRLRLRVHGASIGLLGDGRAPCVMRHAIACDCRPFVASG